MTDKRFTANEQAVFEELLVHRRDVRGNRFLDTPIDDSILEKIVNAANLSPSVGLSQPWELVIVRNAMTKQAVADVFEQENIKAQALFDDEKGRAYAQLKLEGILASPVNIAVFYRPSKKPVLGQTSMPDMGEYSVVCAIQNMWLMARALNIGMGWVSILDPDKIKQLLAVPSDYKLIGYLCFGHVSEFLSSPELELLKWKQRTPIERATHLEKFSSGRGLVDERHAR